MHMTLQAAEFMFDTLKENRKVFSFYHRKRYIACVLFSSKWKLDKCNYKIVRESFQANIRIYAAGI